MRTTKRLNNHKSAQCKVYIDNDSNRIDFISYTTRVISIWYENGKRMIECTGTYSATTRKQISWFLREYAPDLSYYDMKAIAGGRGCGYVITKTEKELTKAEDSPLWAVMLPGRAFQVAATLAKY